MFHAGPIRAGTRGGQGDFTWAQVGSDKDRENYLGHSINAPTGRWQKNKDVHWYNRDKDDSEASKREELRKIKEAEEDAIAVALGFKPAARNGESSSGENPNMIPVKAKEEDKADEAALEAKRLLKEEKRKLKDERRAEKDARRAQKERERGSDRRSSRRDYDRERDHYSPDKPTGARLSRYDSPPRRQRSRSRTPPRYSHRDRYTRSPSPPPRRAGSVISSSSRRRSRSPPPAARRRLSPIPDRDDRGPGRYERTRAPSPRRGGGGPRGYDSRRPRSRSPGYRRGGRGYDDAPPRARSPAGRRMDLDDTPKRVSRRSPSPPPRARPGPAARAETPPVVNMRKLPVDDRSP